MSADAWAAAAAALAAAVCCAAWLDAALPAAAGRYARPGTGSLTAHPDALFLALWAGATAVTALVMEAIQTTVSGAIGSGAPSRRTP